MAAIPLVIQTYFIFFITWFGGRKLKLPYAICSPAAMIGASNFFELVVAVAIALFGLESPAALVTVVGFGGSTCYAFTCSAGQPVAILIE